MPRVKQICPVITKETYSTRISMEDHMPGICISSDLHGRGVKGLGLDIPQITWMHIEIPLVEVVLHLDQHARLFHSLAHHPYVSLMYMSAMHMHIILLQPPAPLVIQPKLFPKLGPFILLLHHVLNHSPHTPTDLLPLPRIRTPALPLPLRLVSLLLRNLLRFTRLQALQPARNLRLFGLEGLHVGDKIRSTKGRIERGKCAAKGFGCGDEVSGSSTEIGDCGVEVGKLLGRTGVFRVLDGISGERMIFGDILGGRQVYLECMVDDLFAWKYISRLDCRMSEHIHQLHALQSRYAHGDPSVSSPPQLYFVSFTLLRDKRAQRTLGNLVVQIGRDITSL
jgi:hypothetical protein